MLRNLGIAALLLCAAGLIGWQVWSQQRAAQVDVISAANPDIVLICTETKQVTKTPWQPTPAVNPATGRATFVEALYCPDCQTWYPAPPPEAADQQRRGPQCPLTGTPLVADGPVPAAAS